jgi:LacI family transcriptional regulator
MARLGYVPNHAAKSLRSGFTRTIGLVIPDIANPYFAELAKGVEDAAAEHGYSVVFSSTNFDPVREDRYLDVMRAGAIDGLVYAAGAPPSSRRLGDLAKSFPMAVADEELAGVSATTITSDNVQGGRLVGLHLAGLGHQRVLYLGGPIDLRTTHQRLEGLRAGLGSNGQIETAYGDYREQSGYDLVRARLAVDRSFTAVFAGNDMMALGAMRALTEDGLSLPGDVSVVGYDDIPLAAFVNPSLTTIRQPVYEIGHTAAEQLVTALLQHRPLAQGRVILDVRLVERLSTGIARRRVSM